jgi:myo-inositol-1(or 4)-monophosphatase
VKLRRFRAQEHDLKIEDEMATAARVAQETGRILLKHFADTALTIRAKGERDVVTTADMESEALLLQRLGQEFPADGVIGEEGTDTSANRKRVWYVDPLDGTLNFSRGVPVWSVSLGLFEGDEALVGVVHDPIRGETFCAGRGMGAFLNGSPIRASRLTELSRAFVHVTVDFNDSSQLAGLDDIQRLAPAVLRTRNLGSAALGLAYVAAGRMDVMLHRQANPWDYGAGVLLVREAGGSVSGMDGAPWVPADASVAAAATEALRASLLDTIRSSADSQLQ